MARDHDAEQTRAPRSQSERESSRVWKAYLAWLVVNVTLLAIFWLKPHLDTGGTVLEASWRRVWLATQVAGVAAVLIALFRDRDAGNRSGDKP